MEVRDTVHSPPFWASASNASNPSPSSPHSSSRSIQSGIKPWIIVLVFSIVVLLFLPSILSSPFKNPRSSLSIKSGWDMLNLCLVAFAILCGVLSRTGDGSGSESGSFKQPRGEWTGFSNPTGEVNRTTTIRRMRSTNSYPDLRLETDVWGPNRVPDSWRFFDDAELYRTRRPVQLYRVPGLGEEERECKTIPVDTERLPQMEQVENEANFEEGKVESDTTYEEEKKGGEAMAVRWQRRSLEALPKVEEVANEPIVVVGRRRRRSLERFAMIEEVEKEANFEGVEEEKVQKRQMVARRRRKSSETFPKMEEMEKETKAEEEMVEQPPETVARRKTRSSEKLPEIEEVEKETNLEENMVEKPPLVVEVAPPPPPPPPPPETKAVEECREHKRSGSGGGAKDLASAIALFYQKKKKGNKSKRKERQEASIETNLNSNSTNESNSNPSTVPPPPPPPPPASIFHQLFSNKKGASKSRKIHSLSASTYPNSPSTINIITTPPPPPPPPPPHLRSHWSRKDQIDSSGYRRIENSELYGRRRRERSNLSPYVNYPLPPRSPLPPAPPSPPPVCKIVSESREQEEQKSAGVAVFCASPDVNDKADLFIQRFRAGLKLEKINSIREKEMRKGRREREEFGDRNI